MSDTYVVCCMVYVEKDLSECQHTFIIMYLLPPYSQNGTLPSFCAKYGGLNEYLYSNRLCGTFALMKLHRHTTVRVNTTFIFK